MTSFTITQLTALEILDSRGRPTVQATCHLASGARGTASVPSGASTGTAEALELRDRDSARYNGLGCRRAVANITHEINNAFKNRSFISQNQLDKALLELDGTPNKSRLGANALLGVSIAFARACAAQTAILLFQYFADMIGQPLSSLPRPMINLFSGGKHAGGQVDVQDVQVMSLKAQTIDEVLATTFDIFYTAARLVEREHNFRLLRADEGGLAPPFTSAETMLQAAVKAIEVAGYQPGDDVALTLDVAASHFYHDGRYHLGDQQLNGQAMVKQLLKWLDDYPITSLEDGLAEEDWEHWSLLKSQTPPTTLILGDDLLCTNPTRIQQAIDRQTANALLLKVNQIGTLTEAAEARWLAKAAGWRVVVSARSGETEDDWLADLAVGWSAEFIKVGSITQSERLAKYNRLLAIEQETRLPLAQ